VRVLAIDTALGQCAVAVLDRGAVAPIAAETIALERGHAEALLPMLDRVISRVDGRFSSVNRVAVTVGPGSFTGLRIGISAARAVGLAAGIPVVGVTTLSALMAPVIAYPRSRLVVAALDARGGRVYVQAIGPNGRTVVRPALMSVREIVRSLGSSGVLLVGSGASAVAAEAWGVGLDVRVHDAPPLPEIAWVARLGAAARPEQALPKPLYLAPPDARPQDGARLPHQ
jgi:tRNA threonylcarbamoyl adenosine modification protein YeaZ